jgi:hypothetical protein
MPRIRMAPLAQEGLLCHQHFINVRPVGMVAIETVFTHRHMFPHERSPFVLVALVTELIARGSIQEFWITRTVRAMAGSAIHFALRHGHMGGAAHLTLHVFVALITGFADIALHKFPMALGPVQAMTGRARHIGPIVGTAGPMGPRRVFVAFHAGGCNTCRGHFFEGFDGGESGVCFIPSRPRVKRPSSVTGFTGFFKLDALHFWETFPVGGILKLFGDFLVTRRAGFGADEFGFLGGRNGL